ncbi:hypothetical protein HNR19_003189 [Nocardioides thalensis]|uniref:Uncharacterized protein n=1 Tax=Nocardioides thalensis TaxID=1914755 RepID=A0A853C5Q6_9ACTN|nr:hypothetical protein [Nocardioides thalensis]NYJ02491.1 hypothetical protein [Nocardioides thalensis]
MRDLRRIVIAVVIGSFSVAALMGIAALLGGGEFGEAEGRVLLTTLVIGIESVAVLCYLAVAGRPLAFVGGLGAVVSLVATGTALLLVWGREPEFDSDIWKLLGVSITLAATLAQASLLIGLVRRPHLQPPLWLTMAAAGVVALMILGPILQESDPGGDYWRVFGVVAILDVLGTLVLVALAAFGRRADAPVIAAGHPSQLVALSPVLQRRIAEVAAARGVTTSQVVEEALDHLEGSGSR